MDKDLADELIELNTLLRKSIAAQGRTARATHGNVALIALISAGAFATVLSIWQPSAENPAAAAAVVCVVLAIYKAIRAIAPVSEPGGNW